MPAKKERAFDAQAFLESAGLGKRLVAYPRKDVVISQGDPPDSVMYLGFIEYDTSGLIVHPCLLAVVVHQ
ncbi:MAG: hypothetical protein PVSMB1_04560 [Gemmatimonadaceae bacterium]